LKTHSICPYFVSVCLLLTPPLAVVADETPTEASRTQIVGAAREVYDGLVEAAQSDPELTVAEIESLNAWSTRIELQELSAAGFWDAVDQMRIVEGALPPNVEELGKATRDAIRDHALRLKQIETLVTRKVADHATDKKAVAAARYFRLLADSVLGQMDAKLAAAHSLQDPDPSPLTGKPFVVFINAKNEIIIEKKRVSMKQLAEVFKNVADEKRFAFIDLNASGEALHSQVVEVMDLASDAGLAATLSTVE
jgi:biopolymer transport protein ExbD